MDHPQNPSCSKAVDRKTIEKNRRDQMKNLYNKLNSLIPQQPHDKEAVSLPDQLERATNYIKNLEANLEKLKQKKNSLMEGAGRSRSSLGSSNGSVTNIGDTKLPNIDIHVMGTAIEVVLITALDCQSMFGETIRILYEEDADVVNATFSVIGEAIFHTIHCKIGELAPEEEAARITEKLRKFVQDWC